jgi:hypothetical protein
VLHNEPKCNDTRYDSTAKPIYNDLATRSSLCLYTHKFLPHHLHRRLPLYLPLFLAIGVLLHLHSFACNKLTSITQLRKPITDDDNILRRIAYPKQRQEFWKFLISQKSGIERIVSHHLHVTTSQIGDVNTWISGSFNVCIPVCIDPPSDVRVLIRIPLSYKVGDANNPGNVDEKLRCEAASYMWIQENSPKIPIPKLFGCGFTDDQTVRCKLLVC